MTDTSIYQQPAYLLHSKNYRESSLIVQVLTRDYGKVPILARGVRRSKSPHSGVLRPFSYLNISFRADRELKLLTDVETQQISRSLQGLAMYCGFYMNELLQYFLANDDPSPEIFLLYKNSLQLLQDSSQLEKALRLFEYRLLQLSGYGLQLDYELDNGDRIFADKKYRYMVDQGAKEHPAGEFTGATLIALREGLWNDAQTLKESKKLLRLAIDYHLAYRQLHSRELFKQHKKYLKNGTYAK